MINWWGVRTLLAAATAMAALPVCAGLSPHYYDGVNTSTAILLRGSLSAVISNGHDQLGYDNTWEPLRDIDQSTTSAAHVRLLYGGDIRAINSGTDADGSAISGGWNREHTFPQSFFDGNEPMRSDIHALFPSDSDVNFRRSNSPYDIVVNPTLIDDFGNRSTTDYFEPADIDKGRIARAILYMDVRYEGLNGEPNLTVVNSYPGGTGAGQMAYLDKLLSWHRQHPPDAFEKARNYKTYTYQQNANPFVDHPEWVDDLYGGPAWSTADGDQLVVSALPSAAQPVAAGTVEFPVMVLPTHTTGQEVHISSLVVKNEGTATASDVQQLQLWYDVDQDGAASPHDSLLAARDFGSTETVFQLSHRFYCAPGSSQLLLTATIPFSATQGNTVQISVPNDGFQLSASGGSDSLVIPAPLISAEYEIAGSSAASAGLVISEVFEGSQGNLKYIELYNSTSQTVNLASAGVTLRRYTNGSSTPTNISLGTGSIAPGDVFVLANNSGDFQSAFGFAPDGVNSSISHNGNDLYDLLHEGTGLVVDGFAMDRINSDVSFSTDCAAHRLIHQMPNGGTWGSGMSGVPADNELSPSGYWLVRRVTAGNGNASEAGSPGTLDEQHTPVRNWLEYEADGLEGS